MVRDGIFYGLALLVVAAVVWHFTHFGSLTAIPVILAAFFLWFFRDPSRRVPADPGLVVSPADGKVEEAEWIETTAGGRLRVTIFLNVFDVHVNRTPVGGTVDLVEYREGQFLNAMRPESAVHNEQTLVTIDTGSYKVSFKQIAGLLARHCLQPEAGRRCGARPAHGADQIRLARGCVAARRSAAASEGGRPGKGRQLRAGRHALC